MRVGKRKIVSPHRVLLQPFRIPLWDKKIEALLILRSYSKFWTFCSFFRTGLSYEILGCR